MSNKPRWSYIGGSDVGAILGYSPYQTRIDVYNAKVNKTETNIDNGHIRRGVTMEPIIEAYIREHYDPTINSPENFNKYDSEGKAGGAVTGTSNQIFLQDEQQPYLGGHPDGVGDRYVWEFKAPTMYKVNTISDVWGEGFSIEEVLKYGLPASWVAQIQLYMMITRKKEGRIVVWNYDIWEPHIVPVAADYKLWDRIRRETAELWDHVQMQIPPVAYTESDKEQLNVITDRKLESLLRQYEKAKRQRYKYEGKEKELKSKIVTYAELSGRSVLITPRFTASVNWVQKNGFGYYTVAVKDRSEGEE